MSGSKKYRQLPPENLVKLEILREASLRSTLTILSQTHKQQESKILNVSLQVMTLKTTVIMSARQNAKKIDAERSEKLVENSTKKQLSNKTKKYLF